MGIGIVVIVVLPGGEGQEVHGADAPGQLQHLVPPVMRDKKHLPRAQEDSDGSLSLAYLVCRQLMTQSEQKAPVKRREGGRERGSVREFAALADAGGRR